MSSRRCSFCLVPDAGTLRCARCLNRYYCSKVCQANDWKGSRGQGHKNWCSSLPCGEESVDYAIELVGAASSATGTELEGAALPTPSSAAAAAASSAVDMGCGIIALRPIPRGYRIFVEKLYMLADIQKGSVGIPPPPSTPAAAVAATAAAVASATDNQKHLVDLYAAAMRLEPSSGSLEDKFKLNSTHVPELGGNALGLRLSRANHACAPNAEFWFESGKRVLMLFSTRDIAKGEEVTISYTGALSLNGSPYPINAGLAREALAERWHITCPSDCACRDEAYVSKRELVRASENNIRAGLQLLQQQARGGPGIKMEEKGSSPSPKELLGKALELLELHEGLQSPPLHMLRVLHLVYQTASFVESKKEDAAAAVVGSASTSVTNSSTGGSSSGGNSSSGAVNGSENSSLVTLKAAAYARRAYEIAVESLGSESDMAKQIQPTHAV